MNIFDIECEYENANVVINPVPWDVTTSYGGGACNGPELVFEASPQVDLFSTDIDLNYTHKYFYEEFEHQILQSSIQHRELAQKILKQDLSDEDITKNIQSINLASDQLNQNIYLKTLKVLNDKKIPACLGGDHSVPFGAIKAVSEKYQGNFSILHIDAHHDLREAYQGYTHSHASIFYNVMKADFAPKSLCQLGIRDFCQEEFDLAANDPRIHVFYDKETRSRQYENHEAWVSICDDIISKLSDNVYISVDIDGFDPKLCPNTGTPVPGGLEYNEFYFLLKRLLKQKKKIIGFDLVEVSPGNTESLSSEWDGNVGMRVLFELCKFACISQGKD